MQGKGLSRRAWLRLVASAIAAGALPSAGRAAPPEPRSKPAPNKPTPKRRVIALDPGHGGIDPGAISPNGLYEKEITFETARELTRQLDATRRYKVFLTRTSDEFVALRDRVARARAADADLLPLDPRRCLAEPGDARRLGVHAVGASLRPRGGGARARENKADLIAGIDLSQHAPEVSSILLDLARRQTNNLSIGLARRLVGELGARCRSSPTAIARPASRC